jgi:hypothetical protein
MAAGAIGGVLGIVGNAYGGIASYMLSRQSSRLMVAQADFIYTQELRNARIVEEEGDKFAAEQSLQYLSAGVEITGSALLTLKQTKKYAKTEAENVRLVAGKEKEYTEQQAKIVGRQGKASMISGLLGAGGSAVSSFGGK